MQIRPFSFRKQRIQIIRRKEFNPLRTHLQLEPVSEVVQIEIVFFFIHFFVTIDFIDLLRMTLYAIAGIGADADAK